MLERQIGKGTCASHGQFLLMLGCLLIAFAPNAAISEGVPRDHIRLFVGSRLPDEAWPIFREMIAKEDTDNLIGYFVGDLSAADVAILIVFDWDDLQNMHSIAGGSIMYETAKGLGPAANVVKLLIKDQDSREIGGILYRIGNGSIEKYRCIAHDLFKRIRNERVSPVLIWERCA